ncbi:MAG: 2-isopropylmalate synthase, partial [Oscillospiraceae bacterium]|nr:2-isopropylmalate synthase [Oscillospiraceae bacterium]
STSTLQREVVFHMSREEIKQIAIDGTRMVKERAKNFPGNLRLEYSPESFSGTEVEFSLECCQAVQDVWEPTPENKIIFNLPNTVEQTTPNVYADQIEWMDRHFKDRDCIILSVHPHNDRGCGVAATELALLAGADRVEGTLLGNGERTGNVDILTVAYNMFSQGIDPGLHLENINEIIDVYERCCKMEIDMRHPYAGQLVFTAFSGSHQDAINKGMHAMEEKNNGIWEIPYLPIDPADIGRQYEPVVRINSQSGKGGVAFVMESLYGFKLPKAMQGEFASVIQKISEKQGGEISPDEIFAEFKRQYIAKTHPFEFLKFRVEEDVNEFHRHHGRGNRGTQRHHVGVVVLAGQAGAHVVVEQGAADAGHLIGNDGHANARGAADNALLAFAGGDRLCGGTGKVGIVAAILAVGAKIPVRQTQLVKMLFNCFLELQCAVVTSQCNHL